MRQREGRTGRSRPGRVVYLLSEGREQQHYEDNHAKEQLVKVRRVDSRSHNACYTVKMFQSAAPTLRPCGIAWGLCIANTRRAGVEENGSGAIQARCTARCLGQGGLVYLLSEGRQQQHYEDNHAKEQLVKVRRVHSRSYIQHAAC
jgi:hypothetical protein